MSLTSICNDSALRVYLCKCNCIAISLLQITPEDFPRSVQFLKDDQVLVLTHEG